MTGTIKLDGNDHAIVGRPYRLTVTVTEGDPGALVSVQIQADGVQPVELQSAPLGVDVRLEPDGSGSEAVSLNFSRSGESVLTARDADGLTVMGVKTVTVTKPRTPTGAKTLKVKKQRTPTATGAKR